MVQTEPLIQEVAQILIESPKGVGAPAGKKWAKKEDIFQFISFYRQGLNIDSLLITPF